MKVAICIATRNRTSDLRNCLESLAASTVVPAEVVVSDDGQGADAICREAPLPVRCIKGPGRGVGANRNCVVRAATAEYISFLDDDAVIGPDFLATALAALERAEAEHGRGKVIVSGSHNERGHVLWAHDQSFLGFQRVPYPPGAPLNTIAMSAVIFPRAVFDHVLFDERLRYGYEESDIASRAVAAGYVIVSCNEARNSHYPSLYSRSDYATYENATRLYATFKRYYWTERRRGRAAAFVLVAPLHAVASAIRRGEWRYIRAVGVAVGYTLDYSREAVRP